MIPLMDLKQQYVAIKDEVDAAVLNVFDNTQYILGPAVFAFEKQFAAYCQCGEAVGVNSGTTALFLALQAAGVKPGDEVITVPYTFLATVAAISYIGAKPVLVDIDPLTYTMDPEAFAAAITPKTRAVIPVHLYGQCADMDPILATAKEHDLTVIEDAAQAHGAEYKGRRAGSIGHLGCFSFYPGKNLGAYGEGGAVTTSDPDLADKLRVIRDWGQREKYKHEVLGGNYRMDGVQGAVLGVKMNYIEDWTEARRERAVRYDAGLQGANIVTPTALDHNRHVYHVYTVRHGDRAKLMDDLKEEGVGTGIHYPIPVHLQQAFAHLGYAEGSFPVSEQVASEVLSLPMFPELTLDQIDEVIAAVTRLA